MIKEKEAQQIKKQTKSQQKQEKSDINTKKKGWNWRITLTVGILGIVLGTLTVLVIDKYRMRNVICQIVGVDEENSVIGARCMIK